MHDYRSLHIMAIDSGKTPPHCRVTLWAGAALESACSAEKSFPLEQLSEVRDLIDWAAEAYAQAFDQLHADGWTIEHNEDCPEPKGSGHVEA